jgi:hypothetical protein
LRDYVSKPARAKVSIEKKNVTVACTCHPQEARKYKTEGSKFTPTRAKNVTLSL